MRDREFFIILLYCILNKSWDVSFIVKLYGIIDKVDFWNGKIEYIEDMRWECSYYV